MLYKKLSPIYISALAVACVATIPSVPTSALYQDDQGANWWSVEELLQYADEVDAEEKTVCGDDIGCREELFYSKLDAHDQKYESLEVFRQQQFWVTSINPDMEKLDMIYFDQDPMLRRLGFEEHDPLRYVYLSWSLSGKPHIRDVSPDYPLESQIDPEDTMVVYAGHDYQFGSEGFPVNEVFALPINHTNLSSNTRGHLFANTYGHSFYNASTGINYASCLNSPDYISGESCDLMFSAEHGSRYFPHNLVKKPSSTEEDDHGNETLTPDSTSNSDSETQPSVLPSNEETNSNQSSDQKPESNTNSEKASISKVVTDSDNTKKGSQSQTDSSPQAQILARVGSSQVELSSVSSDSQIVADNNWHNNTEEAGFVEAKSTNDTAEPLAESAVELPAAGGLGDKCKKEIIFPWWFILLILIADALILWLFWPKNRKKAQENS